MSWRSAGKLLPKKSTNPEINWTYLFVDDPDDSKTPSRLYQEKGAEIRRDPWDEHSGNLEPHIEHPGF